MATYQSALRSTKKFGIPAGTLKLIAMTAMFLDHFAVVIIQNGKLYGYSEEYFAMALATTEGQRWYLVYRLLRLIGRIAFPIFCFLLVQGFLHTSDLRKYVLRLFGLAVLSELPYDLAMYNSTYEFVHQNACFTLVISLLVLCGMRRYRARTAAKWGCVLAGCALAWIMRADYGVTGVLMAALFYNFRKEEEFRLIGGVLLAAVQSAKSYFTGIFAMLPIWFYNGEQGAFHAKWVCYAFYPLHLLAMYGMIYIGAML